MSALTTFLSNPESFGVWNLVPQRSTIRFENKTMWGALKVRGAFTEFRGDGEILDATTMSGRVDIKAASADTGLRKRDEDLQAANFFDVEQYPNITIVVSGGEPLGVDTVRLRAELTVKGISGPLPLIASVEMLDDGAVRLASRTTVTRKQFAVTGNMFGMIGDKTALRTDLVFQHGTA